MIIEPLESRQLLTAGHHLDPTWGVGGYLEVMDARQFDGLVGLAAMSDGRIVALNKRSSGAGLQIARFTPNGFLDQSFADQGLFTRTDISGSSLAVDPSGRILVAVQNGDQSFIYRYRVDGRPDKSFGDNGRAFLDNIEFPVIKLDSADRIVLTGRFASGALVLARLTSAGQFDNSFGESGSTVIDLNNLPGSGSGIVEETVGQALGVDSAGDIFVGGYTHIDDGEFITYRGFVARFDPDGTYHKSIRTTGRFVDALAVQPDGGVVFSLSEVEIERVDRKLALDPTFSSDGVATLVHEKGQPVRNINSILLQSDGDIVVSGLLNSEAPQPLITRFRSDGTVDFSFTRTDGLARGSSVPAALVETSDGAIMLGMTTDQAIGLSYYSIAKFARDDAPAAQLQTATQRTAGTSPLTFKVTYQDTDPVDVATVDANDLQIVSASGRTFRAYFLASEAASTLVIGRYRFAPIDGRWTAADNGSYLVRLKAHQVADVAGHFSESRVLGSISVDLPASENNVSVSVTTVTPPPAAVPTVPTLPTGEPTVPPPPVVGSPKKKHKR